MDFRTYSELYHFGIKGQRWGVRRYQNPDGSLTPAGKERLRKLNDLHAYNQLYDPNKSLKKQTYDLFYSKEDQKYMSPAQKAIVEYSKKSPTYNAMWQISEKLGKEIMKHSRKKANDILKEFKEQGIEFEEFEENRPLYSGDYYVRRVFKQYRIKEV